MSLITLVGGSGESGKERHLATWRTGLKLNPAQEVAKSVSSQANADMPPAIHPLKTT